MARFKVAVTARSFGEGSDDPLAILRAAGCEVIKSPLGRPLTSEELAEFIKDADALIAGNDQVDAPAITAGQRLKVISRYGVGLDNYDLAAATARGIVVTNTPATNDNSVADLAMALLLACARGIPKADRLTKGGAWKRVQGVEIWGKTIGVIGCGRIGRGVVQRARGFDMEVLCHDVNKDEQWAETIGAKYTGFEELLQESDFVSVHIPLLPSTRNLIGRRELRMMRNSAFLINTARGEIIDEEALYQALTSGWIAGAGLDVLQRESADSPLAKLENVVLTAHMGGYTRDAVRNMGVLAAQNVVDVLTGAGSRYVVNGEAAKG